LKPGTRKILLASATLLHQHGSSNAMSDRSWLPGRCLTSRAPPPPPSAALAAQRVLGHLEGIKRRRKRAPRGRGKVSSPNPVLAMLSFGAVGSVQRLWWHSVMESASEERQQALLQSTPMEAQSRFWGSLAELADQPTTTAWHLSIQLHGAPSISF
jgi:hypothetical protein